ncbi:GNAT family N-acetyltransferase [Bacillus subtilis subsp. subtilis]|nr:GNAT family N-acetyltransferase [Bacillus subtilis subsp. subtilis]
MSTPTTIRIATLDAMAALVTLDTVATHDARRVALLWQWISAGHCHVLLRDGTPAGYAVLHYHFFDSGFIEVVMVGIHFRRRGVGEALLQHRVSHCTRPKLFASTHASNVAMHTLLARNGFIASGQIDNLDPGDPERVLFRAVATADQPAM